MIIDRPTIAQRRARLVDLVVALPEAAVEGAATGEGHLGLVVRRKRLGWYLDDHHGDGIVAISAKAGPGVNVELATTSPDRYYLPSYMGPKGWVALRLDRDDVDWEEVEELLVGAYRLVAPRTLVRRIDEGG